MKDDTFLSEGLDSVVLEQHMKYIVKHADKVLDETGEKNFTAALSAQAIKNAAGTVLHLLKKDEDEDP